MRVCAAGLCVLVALVCICNICSTVTSVHGICSPSVNVQGAVTPIYTVLPAAIAVKMSVNSQGAHLGVGQRSR